MNLIKKLSLFALALVLSVNALAQQKSGLHVTNKFLIKGSGGWDYLTVDNEGKRLFVSHGSQVNIITTNGDSVGVLSGTNGVHGIALVHTLNKGYTSNGRDNSCTVFDLKTLQSISTIKVGTNPDAIFYDGYSKKVYTFNGRSSDASVIDPVSDKVVATIPLGGKPETGVSNGKGLIFVNSETTNEVVVINANTYKVEHRYKLEGGEEPTGLAIDLVTNRLFVGCAGSQSLIVMDAATGKNLAKFKTGDCDGVGFDPTLKMIYTSNNEGTMSVIKELSADKYEQLENVTTEQSARTIAVDAVTHKIYLPAARNGSFHIIEVSQ